VEHMFARIVGDNMRLTSEYFDMEYKKVQEEYSSFSKSYLIMMYQKIQYFSKEEFDLGLNMLYERADTKRHFKLPHLRKACYLARSQLEVIGKSDTVSEEPADDPKDPRTPKWKQPYHWAIMKWMDRVKAIGVANGIERPKRLSEYKIKEIHANITSCKTEEEVKAFFRVEFADTRITIPGRGEMEKAVSWDKPTPPDEFREDEDRAMDVTRIPEEPDDIMFKDEALYREDDEPFFSEG